MAEIPGYPVGTIAKLLDLSERHVRRLVQEGILIKPEGKNSRYPITNVTLYIRYLRERAFGKAMSETDLHTEKLRYAKTQADKLEIELSQLKKEVVNVDDVRSLWIKYSNNLRTRLLNMPSKIAHQMIGIEEYSQAEEIIREEVNESLSEVARDGVPKRVEKDMGTSIQDAATSKTT